MEKNQINNLYKAGLTFLIILSLFTLVKTFSGWKHHGMNGEMGTNVITLSGHGEVSAVPDIANVYFNIHKEAKTVKEAQDAVAQVEKSVLDFLKTNKIEDKDIKTSNASFNPKYEYRNSICAQPADGAMVYCPPGKQVPVGFEANESITLKIRAIDDAGKIIQGLGGLGVSELNGPTFAIDKEDDLKAEARKNAIEDAKTKAEALAKDLGVRLGDISNFTENGNYPYYESYLSKDMMSASAGSPAPATLPKGENTISSDVSITYEIK